MRMNNSMNPTAQRSILTVKKKENLTPHYIRITFTGDDVPLFKDATIGKNNKIFFPPEGTKEVHFPRVDEANGDAEEIPENLKPIRRTYTHRGIDLDKGEMYVDFIAHGDSGPASAWALRAKPGDPLGIAMKLGTGPLHPPADWFLFVCDATGIPVIASILEHLPANVKGEAYIEVLNEEEELPLATEADISIHWIHNPQPGEKQVLPEVVRKANIPDHSNTSVFGYVAAEFSSVKAIRYFLRKEVGWPQSALYAYSYWKFGKSEDGSVSDRQEEKKSFS